MLCGLRPAITTSQLASTSCTLTPQPSTHPFLIEPPRPHNTMDSTRGSHSPDAGRSSSLHALAQTRRTAREEADSKLMHGERSLSDLAQSRVIQLDHIATFAVNSLPQRCGTLEQIKEALHAMNLVKVSNFTDVGSHPSGLLLTVLFAASFHFIGGRNSICTTSLPSALHMRSAGAVASAHQGARAGTKTSRCRLSCVSHVVRQRLPAARLCRSVTTLYQLHCGRKRHQPQRRSATGTEKAPRQVHGTQYVRTTQQAG